MGFSKFFTAVDVPFRLLFDMRLIFYFIHSDQCHLTLPLFCGFRGNSLKALALNGWFKLLFYCLFALALLFLK